jgi:preprotein translocase subunit SecE
MARARKRTKQAGPQEFDATRWAHAVFAVFAGIAAWMFSHLIEDSWGVIWARWPQYVGRPSELWAQAAGVTIGIALVIWLWSRERYFQFIADVATEVSQIIWPTRAETRAATVVVIVITLISSVILWAMDNILWSPVTDWLYTV